MSRPKHCRYCGLPLKTNSMEPLEVRVTRRLLGVREHERERKTGKPRALSREAFGRLMMPPVTDRTVYNWEKGATSVPVWHIRQIRKLKRGRRS